MPMEPAIGEGTRDEQRLTVGSIFYVLNIMLNV